MTMKRQLQNFSTFTWQMAIIISENKNDWNTGVKDKLPYNPTIPLLGKYHEETESEKDIRTPMLRAALFTIARTWKQLRCPSTDKEVVVHIHNRILFSHKKEHIWVSSNEVDEPRTYYTE